MNEMNAEAACEKHSGDCAACLGQVTSDGKHMCSFCVKDHQDSTKCTSNPVHAHVDMPSSWRTCPVDEWAHVKYYGADVESKTAKDKCADFKAHKAKQTARRNQVMPEKRVGFVKEMIERAEYEGTVVSDGKGGFELLHLRGDIKKAIRRLYKRYTMYGTGAMSMSAFIGSLRREGCFDLNTLYKEMPYNRVLLMRNPQICASLIENGVQYLDEEGRKQYEYNVDGNGLIVKSHRGPNGDAGSLLDTCKMSTHFSGKGWAIYVIDPEGRIYSNSHELGVFHHSSFLSGGAVKAAGEWLVSKGRIIAVTTKTGHYHAGALQLASFVRQLGDKALSSAKIGLYAGSQLTGGSWTLSADEMLKLIRGPKLAPLYEVRAQHKRAYDSAMSKAFFKKGRKTGDPPTAAMKKAKSSLMGKGGSHDILTYALNQIIKDEGTFTSNDKFIMTKKEVCPGLA